MLIFYCFFFFFFFQAEDGIRDLTVTGVQTCALPISTVQRGREGAGGELLRSRHAGRPLARNGVRDGADDRVPEWWRPEPLERHYHGFDGGPRVRGELRGFRAIHRRQRGGAACANVPPPDRTGRRHPPFADPRGRQARQSDADHPTEVAGLLSL